MERERSDIEALLAGVVAGACAMYLLDPDRGRRRRAIVRDKARSALAHGVAFGRAALRDARHRVEGAAARARAIARRGAPQDDLRLIERVRARIGRVVGNPHAIHVGALEGRVTVSGPVLASEADLLIDAVRSVRGVRSVDAHLVRHVLEASVPSLQGARLRSRLRAARGGGWTPATRGAVAIGGSLLAMRGLASGGLGGAAAVVLGVALALRAADENDPQRRVRRIEDAARETAPPLG